MGKVFLDEQKTKLGFSYRMPAVDLAMVTPDKDRVYFRAKKMFEQIIFDTVKLEDNPFTFPEVKTLLDGITVGGHRLRDHDQVLRQALSWKHLFSHIRSDSGLALNKVTFCMFNCHVARDEAELYGIFRTGQSSINGTSYKPPPSSRLEEIFKTGLEYIKAISNPIERAMVFFLFGSLHQFFWDGNRRTCRLMMNGVLLSAGYDVINIPAKRDVEYIHKLVRFYEGKDGSEMLHFLLSCSLNEDLHPMSMHSPPHPGEIIRALCIVPSGLSVTELAEKLGVSRSALSALLNGRRGISPTMATRLSTAFGGSAESWIEQQEQYDQAQEMSAWDVTVGDGLEDL